MNQKEHPSSSLPSFYESRYQLPVGRDAVAVFAGRVGLSPTVMELIKPENITVVLSELKDDELVPVLSEMISSNPNWRDSIKEQLQDRDFQMRFGSAFMAIIPTRSLLEVAQRNPVAMAQVAKDIKYELRQVNPDTMLRQAEYYLQKNGVRQAAEVARQFGPMLKFTTGQLDAATHFFDQAKAFIDETATDSDFRTYQESLTQRGTKPGETSKTLVSLDEILTDLEKTVSNIRVMSAEPEVGSETKSLKTRYRELRTAVNNMLTGQNKTELIPDLEIE